MHVLGISAYYHDSAAALVSDGKIVAAVAEERFSRVKHDKSFPSLAIEACMEIGGISSDEIDHVMFYERPSYKFLSSLKASLQNFPFGLQQFNKVTKHWLADHLWTRLKISNELSIAPSLISFAEHHKSHAAYAFYTSPFTEATVITLDGVGEDTSGAVFSGSRASGLEQKRDFQYPNSLGLFYSAITGFLGFRPNDAECNVMALAAYGTPRWKEELCDIIDYSYESGLHIRDGFLNFKGEGKDVYLENFVERFGSPVISDSEFYELVETGANKGKKLASSVTDMATSTQTHLEDLVLQICADAKSQTGHSSLCFAGGVAMNSVLVRKVIESQIFENVYVPPAPNDAGSAVGAAMLSSIWPSCFNPVEDPTQIYLGPEVTPQKVVASLQHMDPSDWSRFQAHEFETPKTKSVKVLELAAGRMASECAKRIRDKKIVGWARGRAEFGPRALGARSILCHPGDPLVAKRLSNAVKKRAEFRPYALSITQEEAQRLLLDYAPQPPFHWMQSTAGVRPEKINEVVAATHVDGSTRPHVCPPGMNDDFLLLLHELKKEIGIGAVLNTSLNLPGDPLATTAEDAFLMFAQTEMDVLIIGDFMLEKEYEE